MGLWKRWIARQRRRRRILHQWTSQAAPWSIRFASVCNRSKTNSPHLKMNCMPIRSNANGKNVHENKCASLDRWTEWRRAVLLWFLGWSRTRWSSTSFTISRGRSRTHRRTSSTSNNETWRSFARRRWKWTVNDRLCIDPLLSLSFESACLSHSKVTNKHLF